MTNERMNEIAALIVSELEPEETEAFATVLRHAIENGYTTEDLEIIDAGLLAAGLDANPICRKRLP